MAADQVIKPAIAVLATFAYSGGRQAAYAAPPFLAPTPPGTPPVKARRARLDVVLPGHG